MARVARGVTCRTCGCLNFSSEHEECDKCRSKTAVSRRSSQGKSHASASTNRLREDAAHSNGKKRRYEETKNTSNKRPQPDVIDLISDDEEDQVVVQKVTSRREKEDHADASGQRELFQSRVFPTVFFKENDFPSIEQGAVMRKHAAYGGVARSHPAAANSVKAVVSQPVHVIRSAQAKPVDPKSVEPRPPPADKIDQEKTKRTDSGEATGIEAAASTAPTDAAVKNAVQLVKDAAQVVSRSEKEDPFFQSRVFGAVEFQASDFVTVFDGLAVARRSQPPALKANSSASSKAKCSTSAVPATAAVSAGPSANEGTGLEAPSTAPSDTTKKPISEAKPAANAATNPIKATGVPTVPMVPARKTATTAATKAAIATPTTTQSSAPPPISNPPRPASKPTLASPTVAVLPPAPSKLTTVQVAPTFSKPPTQGSSTAMPATSDVKTKAAAVAKAGIPSAPASSPVPTQVAQPAMISGVQSISLSVPATAASRPAPVTTNSLTTAAAIPYSTAEGAATVDPAATKVPSPTNRNAEMPKAGASVNVLLAKKKHPEGMKRTNEAQQRTKPPPIVTDSADGDAVLFVKVNAAPLEMTPVEPPVLGYCSPEFLAFMRECGDEDADEDDDPEEVSRSQLKLLDVVDLTNLSDSEDSGAESPMPTPRASVAGTATLKQGLPGNTQTKGTGLPVATLTTTVSGNRTWYVPTLDSERTRTRPEKVMCELCEETGLPSRLVRCPTCTKYFHRKCARENGDENVCWNCELGSMIDDSELDEEHAKYNSEYLAYLRAMRRSASSDDSDGIEEEEEEQEEDDENQDAGSEDAAGDDDVEMANPAEGGEDDNSVSEESSAGKRWKEFIGGATADVEDSYHEITKRIAEELRDEEKRQIYSRGFVSRDEFEAQMAEVEEYYISEEARLQQLEREKALEGRKAAEARRAHAAAEQAALGSAPNGEPPADRPHANENKPPSVPTTGNVVQPVANLGAGIVATSAPPPVSTAATTQSVAAPNNTSSTPAATATTAPSAAPVASHPTGSPWPQFYEAFTTAFKASVANPTTTTASPAAQP